MDETVQDHRAGATRQLEGVLSSDRPLNLVEAALWVAAAEFPELNVGRQFERVRLLAAEGAERVAAETNPFARLDGLRTYFFEDLGFRGNQDDYDDPENVYVNRVIDRRLGIPLTLSILFIEVARAAGFRARGVGLPGHFVCGVTWDGRDILVDPYHGGHVITLEDCRALVARSTGRSALFKREHLEGVDERTMLGRLLLNLKHVYLGRADYSRALSAVDRLLLVWPGDAGEIRDRGFLQAHLGRPGAAIADLETYLTLAPVAPDAESVRGRLDWLRRRLAETS